MAGKADTWMPLYIADYLRKTMHLTRDQHGGYMLLLMACWDRGGRLPNEPGQLAGIARATPSEWKRLAPVLLPFFEVEGGFLVQGRVVEEREKALRLSEARRESGSKGGRPKKQPSPQSETNGKAIGFDNRPQTETPARVALPSPSPPPIGGSGDADASLSLTSDDEPGREPGYPELFEAAWRAYPHVKGRSSKPKALSFWRRMSQADRRALPSAAASYGRDGREPKAECGAPGMHLWLRDAKHEDWLVDGERAVELAPWPGPAEIRAAVVRAKDEGFARSYLDPSGWRNGPDRLVLCRNDFAVRKLNAEVADVLAEHQVRAVFEGRAQ